jgi:hypothetical protein
MSKLRKFEIDEKLTKQIPHWYTMFSVGSVFSLGVHGVVITLLTCNFLKILIVLPNGKAGSCQAVGMTLEKLQCAMPKSILVTPVFKWGNLSSPISRFIRNLFPKMTIH